MQKVGRGQSNDNYEELSAPLRESEVAASDELQGRYLLLELLILLIPLPVMLNVDPGCVPGLIFIVTAPSRVRTSAEEPKIA